VIERAEPVLEAEDVHLDRGGRAILRGVSFALFPGEAVALVGPNAAGKSTLLRVLTGLLPRARGRVRLGGRALEAWSRTAVARQVALVLPESEESTALAVADRVALGRYPYRGPFRPLLSEDRAAVERALRQTGIEGLGRRRLATLSAGERQLAGLARGLAQEPRVLLLDEPAAHLDVGHQLRLFRVLDEIRACGVAVLAVVHDLARAAQWSERLVVLDRGAVAAEGSPAEVLESDACMRAFGVRIRGYPLPGTEERAWRFEETP
jgi:ABC-type cobalamin/Fe3+-siderophores transport system ATPase subunit